MSGINSEMPNVWHSLHNKHGIKTATASVSARNGCSIHKVWHVVIARVIMHVKKGIIVGFGLFVSCCGS
jgi:hypothetical protein